MARLIPVTILLLALLLSAQSQTTDTSTPQTTTTNADISENTVAPENEASSSTSSTTPKKRTTQDYFNMSREQLQKLTDEEKLQMAKTLIQQKVQKLVPIQRDNVYLNRKAEQFVKKQKNR